MTIRILCRLKEILERIANMKAFPHASTLIILFNGFKLNLVSKCTLHFPLLNVIVVHINEILLLPYVERKRDIETYIQTHALRTHLYFRLWEESHEEQKCTLANTAQQTIWQQKAKATRQQKGKGGIYMCVYIYILTSYLDLIPIRIFEYFLKRKFYF
jgi:hypothetical protein